MTEEDDDVRPLWDARRCLISVCDRRLIVSGIGVLEVEVEVASGAVLGVRGGAGVLSTLMRGGVGSALVDTAWSKDFALAKTCAGVVRERTVLEVEAREALLSGFGLADLGLCATLGASCAADIVKASASMTAWSFPTVIDVC